MDPPEFFYLPGDDVELVNDNDPEFVDFPDFPDDIPLPEVIGHPDDDNELLANVNDLVDIVIEEVIEEEYHYIPAVELVEDELLKECPEYNFRLYNFQEEYSLFGENGFPKDRSGHRIIYHKGKIFSFGGYNPSIAEDDEDLIDDEFWPESNPLFKELWELNIFSKKWRKIPIQGDIPEQLASHTAVSHPLERGTMVVYGGTGNPFGFTTSNTVASCNLDTAVWKKVPTVSDDEDHLPQPLYGQAVVVDKEKGMFYTVGGTSGFHYYMDVHRLDLTQTPPKWTKLYQQPGDENEPRSRYRHELCLYDNKIFVLGGGTSFMAERFDFLPTFCLANLTWSYTKTFPDPDATIDLGDGNGYPDKRRCHGACQDGFGVFIFGGYDGTEIYADVWRLDLVTMRWGKLPGDLPRPVYFHASTLTEDGKLYIFGGVDNVETNSRTNKVFSGWIKIPSLRALAWEAVTNYVDIDNVEPAKLLEEGVPSDYVSMLLPPQAEYG